MTEMELSLRSQCQKLLVVEKKKLNGAHLMIQKSPAIPMCLAVRVYYPEDVKLLDERLSKAMKPSNEKDIDRLSELLHGSKANPTGNQLKERDFDGLKAFLDKFQSTVVICVLPEGSMAYFDQPVSHCTGTTIHSQAVVKWHVSSLTALFTLLLGSKDLLGQFCSTHDGQP